MLYGRLASLEQPLRLSLVRDFNSPIQSGRLASPGKLSNLESSNVVSLNLYDVLLILGQEIVLRENVGPRERSRLWRAEDVCRVLTIQVTFPSDLIDRCLTFLFIAKRCSLGQE
jgi:hypothetical protein